MEQRERILKGAEELFYKAGVKSITMNDIAGHLGMSKKTIYQFFSDKGAIVHEIALNHIERDRLEICNMVKTSTNVIEQIMSMLKCSAEIIGNINPVTFFDLQKYHPETWMLFEEFKTEVMIKNLELILDRGIKQGYFKSELDVRIMARLRVNEVDMGFNPNIFPSKDFNIGNVQSVMMEHFIYGICTAKGYETLLKYKQTVKAD